MNNQQRFRFLTIDHIIMNEFGRGLRKIYIVQGITTRGNAALQTGGVFLLDSGRKWQIDSGDADILSWIQ